MDILQSFPSKYLKAIDLQGAARRVTIATVAIEEIAPGEQKPVVHFEGIQQGLVLNKTNAMLMASLFGAETTGWTGKAVELYAEPVPFQGRIVDAVRVRAVPPPTAQPAAAPEQSAESAVTETPSTTIEW